MNVCHLHFKDSIKTSLVQKGHQVEQWETIVHFCLCCKTLLSSGNAQQKATKAAGRRH